MPPTQPGDKLCEDAQLGSPGADGKQWNTRLTFEWRKRLGTPRLWGRFLFGQLGGVGEVVIGLLMKKENLK